MQVTGYVLMTLNVVNSLGLNNLRIIRGETLIDNGGETDSLIGYSLYISVNYVIYLHPPVGLQELQLTSLRGEETFRLVVTIVVQLYC